MTTAYNGISDHAEQISLVMPLLARGGQTVMPEGRKTHF